MLSQELNISFLICFGQNKINAICPSKYRVVFYMVLIWCLRVQTIISFKKGWEFLAFLSWGFLFSVCYLVWHNLVRGSVMFSVQWCWPGNFSDCYCTGADYEMQILLIWNLKEEIKRQNSAFTSVTIQSYIRKLAFLGIDCVHLPQQSAFIDNYLLVLNQLYVKQGALLSGKVNNIDSILKWIQHRRN